MTESKEVNKLSFSRLKAEKSMAMSTYMNCIVNPEWNTIQDHQLIRDYYEELSLAVAIRRDWEPLAQEVIDSNRVRFFRGNI